MFEIVIIKGGNCIWQTKTSEIRERVGERNQCLSCIYSGSFGDDIIMPSDMIQYSV